MRQETEKVRLIILKFRQEVDKLMKILIFYSFVY